MFGLLRSEGLKNLLVEAKEFRRQSRPEMKPVPLKSKSGSKRRAVEGDAGPSVSVEGLMQPPPNESREDGSEEETGDE
jgi:hypothetical protein